MGNNQAGQIAGCVVGSASGVLGLGAGFGGCAPLLAIPPAFAACVGGLSIAGFVGGALGAQACKNAAAGDGQRKKRYAKGGRGRSRNFLEFDALDTDGDGFLTNRDMPTQVSHEGLKNVIMSIMLYSQVIDVNRDKKISPQELANFRDIATTNEGSMDLMFRGMDTNADGRLTPDEMMHMTATCSVLGGNTDAFTGCSDTMRILDKKNKGWVSNQDLKSFYQSQPPVQGSPGIWKYYVDPNQNQNQFQSQVSQGRVKQYPTSPRQPIFQQRRPSYSGY